MVGEHDAARTYADGRCRMSDMRQHHRSCGRCDARHAVMFGNPIAMEAELFGMNGEGGGVDEGLANGASFDDGDKVQNGKTDHRPDMGR